MWFFWWMKLPTIGYFQMLYVLCIMLLLSYVEVMPNYILGVFV